MGRVALGRRHQSSPAQTTTRQKSWFLLSFLPALWFLAVQCCSFYTDLQARERWGYLPEMWECGLKSPQAEEASNPSLNGGPSAVARNAADHRLSCIIDSSPVSVAKSIWMLLHLLPAAVLTQGSTSIPAPSLSLRGGPCRPVLLLPMGSFAAGSLQLRQKVPTQRGLLSSLYFWVKNISPWFQSLRNRAQPAEGCFGTKGFYLPCLGSLARGNHWRELLLFKQQRTAGSCCGPGAVLGGDQWCGHLTNPPLPPARAGPSLGVETRQQLSSLLQTLNTDRSSAQWTPAGLPSEETTPQWV